MVKFSLYVGIAYETAEEKGFVDQLRGPGTQEANQQFMSQLAAAYNANDHDDASEQAARAFLREAVGPP